MYLTFLRKKEINILICTFLVFILVMTSVKSVSAAPDHSLSFDFRAGGSWTYTSLDTNITKNWSPTDYRRVTLIKKVTFLSPAQVQAHANLLGEASGISGMVTPIKYLIEAAASQGTEYAKRKIVEKYGKAMLTKILPYVSIFTWSYTAFDILDAMVSGQEQYTFSKAAKLGKGLIWEQLQTVAGTSASYYYWDGSTEYGSFPTAKLGPNNYQFGDIIIN